MIFSESPSGGMYEVHLERMVILLRLHLRRLGSALVRIRRVMYCIDVELVGIYGYFTDVTGSRFRSSKCGPIYTTGKHIWNKTVRACGSGNPRIHILSTSIHLIPALDILGGMRCPPVDVPVLRMHSLVVHSGQIHDFFGVPNVSR